MLRPISARSIRVGACVGAGLQPGLTGRRGKSYQVNAAETRRTSNATRVQLSSRSFWRRSEFERCRSKLLHFLGIPTWSLIAQHETLLRNIDHRQIGDDGLHA